MDSTAYIRLLLNQQPISLSSSHAAFRSYCHCNGSAAVQLKRSKGITLRHQATLENVVLIIFISALAVLFKLEKIFN